MRDFSLVLSSPEGARYGVLWILLNRQLNSALETIFYDNRLPIDKNQFLTGVILNKVKNLHSYRQKILRS